MSDSHNGRRGFLKRIGTGLTMASVFPMASVAQRIHQNGKPFKIGVIISTSGEQPHLSHQFLKGLNLSMAQHKLLKGNNLEIIEEPIRAGAALMAEERCKKLLTYNEVDMVMAMVNPEVALQLGELFRTAEKPLVIVNAGENYPSSTFRDNAYLFQNSLHLYQCNYRMGQHAVKKYGQRIYIATDFFECGFDALYAFRLGVEEAGGEVVHTFIAPNKQQTDETALLESIGTFQPDAVFAFKHGEKATSFMNTYALSASVKNIPLLTTGFGTDDSQLHHLLQETAGAESYMPWSPELTSASNQKFIKGYQDKNHETPGAFAMLGYECGQMIYHTVLQTGPNPTGNDLAKGLRTLQFESPRGAFQMNPENGLAKSPAYLRQLSYSSKVGHPINAITDQITLPDDTDVNFASMETELKSGWLNPYPFV